MAMCKSRMEKYQKYQIVAGIQDGGIYYTYPLTVDTSEIRQKHQRCPQSPLSNKGNLSSQAQLLQEFVYEK